MQNRVANPTLGYTVGYRKSKHYESPQFLPSFTQHCENKEAKAEVSAHNTGQSRQADKVDFTAIRNLGGQDTGQNI